jgi:hypothetical protein
MFVAKCNTTKLSQAHQSANRDIDDLHKLRTPLISKNLTKSSENLHLLSWTRMKLVSALHSKVEVICIVEGSSILHTNLRQKKKDTKDHTALLSLFRGAIEMEL